jgi:hypothetical protein
VVLAGAVVDSAEVVLVVGTEVVSVDDVETGRVVVGSAEVTAGTDVGSGLAVALPSRLASLIKLAMVGSSS